MRPSSFANIGIVLLLFGALQSWVMYAKFFQPVTHESTQAYLTGQSVTVGTPVSGIVQSVNVTEGQSVEKGQPLFLISQKSPLENNGERPVAVVAQQAGTIYDIEVVSNSFVQASQILAHIVDNRPQALYVQATLSLSPEEFSSVVTSRRATVHGSAINDGKPVPSVITSVGLYDGSTRTVDVRLRMLDQPVIANIATILRLPVEVTIESREPYPAFMQHAVAETQ